MSGDHNMNQKPVAWVCEGCASDEKHSIDYQQDEIDAIPIGSLLYAHPPAAPRQRVTFPTMLRKMWSGREVQAWLDENVNKEKNT